MITEVVLSGLESGLCLKIGTRRIRTFVSLMSLGYTYVNSLTELEIVVSVWYEAENFRGLVEVV